MSNNVNTIKKNGNPFDVFIIGARKGFTLATQNLMPNVLMAYTIAEVLKILGVMAFMGKIFGPVMGLFGVPGEAITVLLTCWLSASAGVGVMVNLLSSGVLNGVHATILLAACFLMGSQLQYMGRLLGVVEVPKKYWPLLMAVSIINALLSMFIMRFIA